MIPAEIRGGMRIGSLFSGYGGLDLAVVASVTGASVAWHAEIDKHASRILSNNFPGVPNLGDIAAAVNWAAVEPVQILTGGFPKDGRPRLSPAFVEWMMGLPAGWVTDTGIPSSAQLKALGNGVVPQQAALALSMLLDLI